MREAVSNIRRHDYKTGDSWAYDEGPNRGHQLYFTKQVTETQNIYLFVI